MSIMRKFYVYVMSEIRDHISAEMNPRFEACGFPQESNMIGHQPRKTGAFKLRIFDRLDQIYTKFRLWVISVEFIELFLKVH